jgi:hypothetical protein
MYRANSASELQRLEPALRKKAMRVVSIIAFLIALIQSGSAQERPRTVEQYGCKDVMRERGPDRDVAIAFLHGFLLGKSGTNKFDLEILHKQSDAFIERCLENPAEPALEAMIKVKR